MRVVAAQIRPYRLAFKRPLRTAAGQYSERRGAVVLLRDDGDRVGFGDAAPLPGFSDETLKEAVSALDAVTTPSERLRQTVFDSAADIAELLGRLSLVPATRHALDQALLDLLSQRQELPLWRVLGGRDDDARQASIAVHALVDGPKAAKEARARGVNALKVKVGASPEAHDDAKLGRIRDACGPKTLIRLDANGCWQQVGDALSALRRFSRHGIHSVEQPLGARMLDELALLRTLSPVPIAADESVRTLEDLTHVIARRAADAVVIKPMLCGGLQTAATMGNTAAAAGLSVSVTSTLESGVGRFGAMHVAAAINAELWSCGLLSGELLEDDLVSGPQAENGLVSVPTSPGLGCGPISQRGMH